MTVSNRGIAKLLRSPRGRLAAGGLAAVVVLGIVLAVGRPGPSPAVSPSPPVANASATPPTVVGDVLPTPTTTDVVLLVASPDAPTAAEQSWLDDLRAKFGRVDALAYASTTLEALQAYFTVFVVDDSPDLDVSVLRSAFQGGLTIHLLGGAATYRDAVIAPTS